MQDSCCFYLDPPHQLSHVRKYPAPFPGLCVYNILGGTGMITSSSTFCPHPGRVISDLFRQLHVVWHGTGALVYSNHPREAAASSYLAIILGRITSGVPGVETNRD